MLKSWLSVRCVDDSPQAAQLREATGCDLHTCRNPEAFEMLICFTIMNRDDQDNPYGITLLRFCAQRENPFACKGYATQLCNPKDITMY